MVLKKNSYTFVASGSPVVEEIFGKTLTFIPAEQVNHHIDVINEQQSKNQGYILMRVGGTKGSILEGITEGTICYAKGLSEEAPRGYYQYNPVKLFVCEEIGIVEPVKRDDAQRYDEEEFDEDYLEDLNEETQVA